MKLTLIYLQVLILAVLTFQTQLVKADELSRYKSSLVEAEKLVSQSSKSSQSIDADCTHFNARWSCKDSADEAIQFDILVLIRKLETKKLQLQISSVNKDLVLNLDNQLYPQSSNSAIAFERSARGECQSLQLLVTENSSWLGTEAAVQVNVRFSKSSKDSRLMTLVFEIAFKKNSNVDWSLPVVQKFNCRSF